MQDSVFMEAMMLIPAIMLVLIVWALITIIGRIRRQDKISVVHWVVLLIGLIGIDLWRVLEGFTPPLKYFYDLALFLLCSGLVVIGPPVALGVYRHLVRKQSSALLQTGAAETEVCIRRGAAARIAKRCLTAATSFALIVAYIGSIYLGASYTYGMSWLPNNRKPSGQGLPVQAVQATWAAEFGSGPIVMEPGPMVMEPWRAYILIRPLLGGRCYGPDPFPFQKLLGLPNGYGTASFAAQAIRRRDPISVNGPRSLGSAMRENVAAMWISRNWTAEQAVRTILAEKRYVRNGCHGFEEASRGYFGLLPNQLTIDEIALLAYPGSTADPWNYPESAKKQIKYVLARLAGKYGSDPSEPDPQLPSRLLAKSRREACKNESEDDDLKDLMASSWSGNLSKMKQLIEKGIDVNARHRSCRTALINASRCGHREMVALLLDKGAHINTRNDFGWTALMEASLWGRLAVAKMLMDRGADVNVKDNWGASALMLAASNGHTKIIELLKAHGAKE